MEQEEENTVSKNSKIFDIFILFYFSWALMTIAVVVSTLIVSTVAKSFNVF